MVTAAQIIQHSPSVDHREEKCLEILLQAEKEADGVISEVLSSIADHDAEGQKLIAEAAALRGKRREIQVRQHAENNCGDEGDERQTDHYSSTFDDDDLSDYEALPKNVAGEEHLHKSRALQQRLRECYLAQHRAKFLQGDVYHWMGESKAGEEAAAYAAAEGLRSKLLKCTFFSYLLNVYVTFLSVVEKSATKAIAQLGADIGKRKLVERDILVKVPYFPRGGILSAHLVRIVNILRCCS
jgi:E3 ubiquitin-protein ligase SHPRH